MKVSIWQEFSSNNSSSYVIVGRFDSPRHAQDAAQRLRAIFRRMWEWYAAHPDDRYEAGSGDYPPTGAEQAVADEYGIEFEAAIDWVAAEESADFVEIAVTVFEDYVFTGVVDETLTRDRPFVQLMRKLGAQIEHHQELYQETWSQLYINISATAPDATTAQFIKTVAESYMIRDRGSSLATMGCPPWVTFRGGQLAPDLEPLNAQVERYAAYEEAWSEWHRANREQLKDLRDRLIQAQKADDQPEIAALKGQLDVLYAAKDLIRPELSPEDLDRLEALLNRIRAEELFEDDLRVEVDDTHIHFHRIWMPFVGQALPALVTWLRAMGCRDVTYEFDSVPHTQYGSDK